MTTRQNSQNSALLST